MTKTLLTALTFIALAVFTLAAMADAGAARPNLVFLMADNLRHDLLGCAGNHIIQTPHIDQLAERGVRLENAFCTTSMCNSSRASVFTGLYRRTHGYSHVPPLRREMLSKSYPVLLKRAGYRTGFVGKFGIDVEQGVPDNLFDFYRRAIAWSKSEPYMRRDDDGNLKHMTRINGDRAISFLRSCRRGQPFCLSVSFSAPHAEYDSPDPHPADPAQADLYQNETIAPAPHSLPADFARLPRFLQRGLSRTWYEPYEPPAEYQRMMQGMYRVITGIDEQVGRIVEELKRLELADNTVIIFTSDNGMLIGEHGLGWIWLIYEGSIRVPLIVYDPRLAEQRRGTVRSEMALNVDLAPTLLDMAGVDVPASMQGRSLVPLLEGDQVDWRTDFFYEFLFEYEGIPKSEGVRGLRYVYARYFEEDPVYEQLFDLERDPHQTENLAEKPNSRAVLNQLRQRCDALRATVTPN